MPQMGYDMREGTLVRWLKAEGSEVQVGEPIAEIETDKAVVEFEAQAAGVLHRILVSEGTTVPVGQPLAVIAAAGESVDDVPAPTPAPAATEPPPQPPQPEVGRPEPREEPPAAEEGMVRASPVARRLADERRIDLRQLSGTGPGGRITRDDVLAFSGEGAEAPGMAEAPAPPPPETEAPPRPAVTPLWEEAAGPQADTIPLSRMRQQIARVTVQSKQQKPHFYITSEVDMTQAMELRRQINEARAAGGMRVTVNDLIIKACVEALKAYPKFNAFFHEDGLKMNEEINIGLAVAVEEGLIVPALMDCGSKSLIEIAQASKDLAERAQSGTLSSREYTGGTFAISNLGMFDVTSFAAIIQPPQSAVLAVGTVTRRPVVRDDAIVVRQMLNATLSADHRIADGAEGAQFLVEIKRLLENPYSLAV